MSLNVFGVILVINIDYKNGLIELLLIWIKSLICSTSSYILYDVSENFLVCENF